MSIATFLGNRITVSIVLLLLFFHIIMTASFRLARTSCITSKIVKGNYSPMSAFMSRTHEKSLARVARMKEKEKEINRLKTHYGKDFKKMMKLHGRKSIRVALPPQPQSKALSKRKIEVQRKLDEIKQNSSSIMANIPSLDEVEKNNLYPLILNIASAANNKKANYISALYVAHATSIAEFLLIIEGNNKAHLQAILDEIEVRTNNATHSVYILNFYFWHIKKLDEMKKPSIQGKSSSGWVLIDYG
jgi:ribosomal silencing factor RsfS